MISDYLKLALKNMKKRRLRAFLTLIGILISIATIFVLISLSLGLEITIQEQFEILGTNKFFIQPRGQFGPPGAATAATLTTDDINVVEKISGVDEVTAYVVGNAKIEFDDELRFVTVLGIEPDKIDVALGSYGIDEGRFLRDSDTKDVMLGSQYKYNNFMGKTVRSGDDILINDVKFDIVGIVEAIGNPQDDRQIYMPITEFRELFGIENRVDFIIVQVSDPNSLNEVADRIEKSLMRSRDVDEDTIDFTILTPEELLETVGTVLNIVTVFLFGIAAISLVVGGINIANTMFTSVLERTREIGVMKAVGAQNKDILSIFLIEAGLLGLIGGILGVLSGFGIGKVIEYVAVTQLSTNLLQISTPAVLIFGCLAFAFLAGAVSGILPAWQAAKVKPVEALRYE